MSKFFFAADAAWLSRNIGGNRLPFFVTHLTVDDFSAYGQTLTALHELSVSSPELRLVPCHCVAATAPLVRSR